MNTRGIARSERDPLQMAPEGSAADVRWPRWLLALLIVVWASSWPVIKIGVMTVPPIWYGCLRYAIAALCLFAIVSARRGLIFPPRSDWPLIAVSATLQMAVYSALTGLALTALPPGRASVLAFSTPIWVVPLAAWRLQERVSPRAMFGLAFGVLGIGAIAAPSIHAGGADGLWAYAMLIAAAAAWAIAIVFVRSHTFAASPLALAPWQMLFAAVLLLAPAILTEGSPPTVGAQGTVSLLYVGLFTTAFAYWAIVELGRHYPASAMAMALLAAPSLGVLLSALVFGEEIGASLLTGMVLIAAGIRFATVQT